MAVFEELPKELMESVGNVKYYSASIGYDVDDALEEANNHEEFKELVKTKMVRLIDEARDATQIICRD